MFNIALALALVLSTLTSFGGTALALIMPAEALRSLPAFLKLIINISVNYWIVAIFIYLLLRAIRADRFLKPTNGIHFLLGSANALTVIYACLRVFASTIEGGGASFVLMSIVGPFIFYIRVALYIGLSWLLVRSIWVKYKKVELPEIQYPPLLKSRSGIAAIILLLPPILLLSATYADNYEKIALAKQNNKAFELRYKQLCEAVKSEVYQRVDAPKSVYFNLGNGHQTLLKELEFVEVGLNHRNMKRYTLKEGAKNKKGLGIMYKDLIHVQITEQTSRYHVIESSPPSEEDRKLGIRLINTKIIDSQTKEILADYSSVRHTKGVRVASTCPENHFSRNSSIQRYVFKLSDEIASNVIVSLTK